MQFCLLIFSLNLLHKEYNLLKLMGSIHILGYQKYFLLFLCKQPLS